MFFNQKLRVGLSSGLVGLLLAVAGCSSTRSAARVDDASAAPAAATPAASTGQDPAASAAGNADSAQSTAVAPAQTAQAAQALPRDVVNPNAPMRYTVKRGDTLWGISSLFLRDPWLWPEIWYDNPQIHNPHRIYPGDVLVLAYGADGRPRIYVDSSISGSDSGGGSAGVSGVIRLEPRLRSSALEGAIPVIPYSSIAAFLSRPTILSVEQVDHAPHVLAFRDEHQAAGENEEAYVRGLGDAPAGARFLVMHIGEKLKDPDSGRLLGYQGLYTATAVIKRSGDPATVTLIEPGRETLRGDCLIPDDNGNPLNFVPRAPTTPVNGRIISVIDDVHAIGQYDIVAINRGTSQGVAPGTVLAVDQVGEAVADRGVAAYDKWGRPDTFAHSVRLPNERAGTLLVFKSYDDMSYALVVGASEQMEVTDIVRNP